MAVYTTPPSRKNHFTVYFDNTVLTNDGGIILIDLKITKWTSDSLHAGFMFGAWQFRFEILEKDMKKLKTKLLLGIPVYLTVPADYSVW